MPLSGRVAPGVRYPLDVSAGDFVVGVASVLFCAQATPDSVSAATAAISVLVACFMTRSLVGLELKRRAIGLGGWPAFGGFGATP